MFGWKSLDMRTAKTVITIFGFTWVAFNVNKSLNMREGYRGSKQKISWMEASGLGNLTRWNQPIKRNV